MGTTEGVNMKDESDKTVLPLGSKFHSSTARKWVGLTDEEIAELFEDGLGFEHSTVISRAIEDKLREKNGYGS